MRVNFLVCGAQKSGTSALDEQLRRHPGICMADQKEVHFFDDEEAFSNEQPDYSLYHRSFPPEQADRLIGESTPIYMYWIHAARRMWSYNPDLKLIVLLRNPIWRAFSHWNMERSRGADAASFWHAIRYEEVRCREALPYQHRIYSYVDRGYYSEQLRRLWAFLPREQVLVLRTETLSDDPEDTMGRVFEFLGLPRLGSIEPVEAHVLPYAVSMSQRERDYLSYTFEYEIKALERMLGWDCGSWLSGGE